jgi:hypothetical protein
MAGNDTAALVVALSAQLTKFEKDMKNAGALADRQARDIEDRFSAINPTFSAIKALIPAAAVTGALASIKSVVDALAELGDKAQDTRLPVQDLQALSIGATQARVSSDELSKAIATFTDVSKKSSDEGKDFYKALQNIGTGFVSAFKDSSSQSDRLRILAQAMASTTDEVKRAQLGLTAFGSDGERVTSYIASLASGMDDIIQRAKDIGIAIDETMVKQAQVASTQLGALAQVIGAELTSSIASLIPSIVELLPYLEKIGALVRDIIASFASPASRPTSTLESEIDVSISRVRDFQNEIADLRKQEANPGFVASMLGKDYDKEIDAIQKKIDKEKEFQALRNQILDRRQDQEDDTPKPAPPPAFKPRPKLNPTENAGQDAFDRTAEQITKHTAAINADTVAVFENNAAREQLRAEFTLLNAIRKDEGEVTQAQIDQYEKLRASMSAEQALEQAHISLTPAHRAAFISASEGARTATANYDAARESLNKLNSASSQVGSALSSAFADAVVEGKSLGDVLTSLAKQLEKMALNSVFSSFFNPTAAGGLSPFASLIKGGFGFDEGGYTGAGGRHQPAGVVHKGEVVWSQDDVMRAGGVAAVEAMRKGLRGYDKGGPVALPAIPGITNSASGDFKLTIINNAGVEIKHQQAVDGRGNRSLQFTIDDAVASSMSRPGSATRNALKNNFAASPVGVRR